MLVNLLHNGIRHNHQPGEARLSAELVDGECVLTVVNTGPVLSKESAARLFEPFQRRRGRVAKAVTGSG